MTDTVAAEIARRNAQATAAKVLDAVTAALRDALREVAADRGTAGLDAFLARRLQMVESLRAPRPGEPPALAAVRERDAAAIEAALRAIVQGVRDGAA